ncbi:LysR family transcriptional regulator [Pendulispora rubella]|uniref:LysR family transcriptional regulator n=1 Tax=Pendulispora rubella TaxID=2741070 RepID=A0ABZ2L1Q5_9BACT
MHDMHLDASDLRGLDLNLVLALHALLVERHVTRAAKRLGLTQSATSHALARLRTKLRDPLLVRAGKGMVVSPRAEAMLGPLERALADIARIVASPAPFDPASAQMRFTIGTSDYIELVLMPKLLARIWSEAPGVDVRIISDPRPWGDSLTEGRADLVLGLPQHGIPDFDIPAIGIATPSGILAKSLFRERFVCVLRKGHPCARRRLDLDTFVSLPHALVSPSGEAGAVVDIALARLGKRRRIAIEVPHFLAAPHMVQQTDTILTLTERVARTFAPSLDLVLVKPPLELPSFSMSMLWHERRRADPAHTWLRSCVAEVSKGI